MSDWLLTPEETAAILGISRRHLLREVMANRMQCALETVTPKGKPRRRYSIQNLRDYLELYCPLTDAAAVIAVAEKKLAA